MGRAQSRAASRSGPPGIAQPLRRGRRRNRALVFAQRAVADQHRQRERAHQPSDQAKRDHSCTHSLTPQGPQAMTSGHGGWAPSGCPSSASTRRTRRRARSVHQPISGGLQKPYGTAGELGRRVGHRPAENLNARGRDAIHRRQPSLGHHRSDPRLAPQSSRVSVAGPIVGVHPLLFFPQTGEHENGGARPPSSGHQARIGVRPRVRRRCGGQAPCG